MNHLSHRPRRARRAAPTCDSPPSGDTRSRRDLRLAVDNRPTANTRLAVNTRLAGRGNRRRGAAAVETAVALPVLFVLVFGAVELADGIFMKQALTVAAYEGARAVSRQKGTAADGQRRIDEVLSARGITEYGYSVEPVATEQTPRSTQLTVRITASSDAVSWSPLRLFSGRTIEKTVSMVRQ